MITKAQILEVLKPVTDPEIRIGIVELGLIYDIEISNNSDITIKMTLTTPACPVGPEITSAVEMAVSTLDGAGNVNVELVWDPPYNPEEMASDYAKDRLGIW
jgi:metal-sulfur cluster biosynthetic enzyme